MCNLRSGQLTNVLFYANSAGGVGEGGGLYNFEYSWVVIENVTFYTNSASSGRAMYNGPYSFVVVGNSILWSSGATGSEIRNSIGVSLNITNSDLRGGWPGTGNIDTDPLFVDPVNGDLHLQAGSPAIDSGTNNGCPFTDLDGNSRPQDGNGDGIVICDMGAYEFVSSMITIKIDIKPGSSTNPINLGAKGVIPVAVLTTKEFNAATLDPKTVLFAGAKPLKWSKKDVDYDGDIDLLFQFDVKKLQLTKTSVEATLTGNTFEGHQVQGTDRIKVVPVPYSYP